MTTVEKGEKLTDLNQTLVGVENELLKRKIADQDETIDGALDIINQAAEAGAIDLDDCDGCEDDGDGGDAQDGDGSEGKGDAEE